MLLQFSYPQYPSSIPLSLIFIKEYMPKANGTFVKVYLYGLSYCYQKNDDLSLQTIGNTLDILESDVMKAFEYWQKLGLVQIQENTKGKFQIEYKIPIAPIPEQSKINETLVSKTKPISIQSKPQYGPKELSIYRKTPEIDQLFKIAERYLGRMLTQQDLSTLYSFYDWLRLPIEVIEILLEHCISNGHRNMRYIEKVAINWVKMVFLLSIKQKLEHTYLIQNTEKYEAFGLSKDPLSRSQLHEKWLTEYDLPLPIILEAYKRTIENG